LKILITDPLAKEGVDKLKEEGFEVRDYNLEFIY